MSLITLFSVERFVLAEFVKHGKLIERAFLRKILP